jgi:Skp family chaperone for outer membrane proteins
MKKLLFVTLFALLCAHGYSANYIVDKDENVIAKITYEPNLADLDSRGEKLVVSDDMPLEKAEFRNKKIQEKIKSKKEKDKEKEWTDKVDKEKTARQRAIAKLVALGLTQEEADSLICRN